MSLEGTQLGQYHLLRLIGSGGMGEVYLAEDARIGQQVAIKVSRTEASPYPDASATQESARLFQREAKAIAQLNHPHILPLFSYDEEKINEVVLTYIVMPYCKEGSLVAWLRHRTTSALLTPQDIAAIIAQAADALQYAHDHTIIHQDVKPANFLVRSYDDASSNVPDLLLTDFGIAKLSSSTSNTSHAVRGTANYMAPEQWIGDAVPATDQYALAVMAYELLTGKPPFQGRQEQLMYAHLNTSPQPPGTLNPRLSSDIDTVIMHALAKKPAERFRSIAAFGRAFQQASQGDDTPTDIKPFPSNPALGTISLPVTVTVPTSDNKTTSEKLEKRDATPELAYTTIQSPVKQKRLSNTVIFMSIAGVMLLILASLGVFYVQNTNNQNNQNNRNATATVLAQNITTTAIANQATNQTNNNNATATSIAIQATNQANNNNATATAIAVQTHNSNATATAVAIQATTQANNNNATATAINTPPYPPSGATLALNDPLSDNSQGYQWDQSPTCVFTNGSYQVSTSTTALSTCTAQATNFQSNFAYQVDVTIVQGDCGGITFLSGGDNFNFRLFEVCQDGSAQISTCTNVGGSVNCSSNGTIPPSSAVHTGLGQQNTLAVVVQNGNLTFYVNQQNVATSSLNGSPTQGKIGVYADYRNSAGQITCGNAKVWTF